MNTIRLRQLQALTAPLTVAVEAVQAVVASTETTAPKTMDGRDRLIMGQDYPVLDPGQEWPMSNRRNYFALQVLSAQAAGQAAQLNLLTDQLSAGDTALNARLALAEAAQAALLAALQQDHAALQALDAYAHATEAKAEAARLANLATAAAATAAQSAAQAADTKAVQAQASATTAQQAAATAQTKADADALASAAAQTAATAAQAAATAAQTSASTAIANAAAAQTAATTALTEERALSARFRVQQLAYTAVTLTVATPLTYAVVFSTPFADASYSAEVSKSAAGLLGVDLSIVNKTAAGFTVRLQNTSLASLAIPAGTFDLVAIHN